MELITLKKSGVLKGNKVIYMILLYLTLWQTTESKERERERERDVCLEAGRGDGGRGTGTLVTKNDTGEG